MSGGLFGHRRYRTDDDRLDAMIQDTVLRGAGIVEDDEPSEYSHYAHMERLEREATGDFTGAERMEIRAALGIGPFAKGADL